MPDTATNARLTRLEEDVSDLRKNLRTDVHQLHSKVDTILASVAELSRGQGIEEARIQSEIGAIKSGLCPKPGSCVDLVKRMDKMESNYCALHDALQQLKGGGKVIAGIWGAIGASVIGGIVWLITHFLTTGKP